MYDRQKKQLVTEPLGKWPMDKTCLKLLELIMNLYQLIGIIWIYWKMESNV